MLHSLKSIHSLLRPWQMKRVGSVQCTPLFTQKIHRTGSKDMSKTWLACHSQQISSEAVNHCWKGRYAPTCCCAKGLKLVCWNIMLDAADSINTLSQVSFPGISSSKSSGLNTPYICLANQWKRDTRGGLYGQNLHCFKLEIMPIGHSDHTIFICTPLKDQVTFNCNLCSLISLQMTKS